MKNGTMWTLALVASLAGCTTSTEPSAGKPTTLTAARMPTGCPLGVSGALATVDDTADGVGITFLVASDRLDELRIRARHAAAMHGPDAHLGPGHAGEHGTGGQHGLQAMQLPPSRATTNDVEAGARILLVPVDPADREALVAKVHEGVRRMNVSACR